MKLGTSTTISPSQTGKNCFRTPKMTARVPTYSTIARLLNSDAGVEVGVADIGDQLREQHDEDRDQRAAEQKVDVVVAGGLDQREAKTLVAEHRLDDDHAGQQ